MSFQGVHQLQTPAQIQVGHQPPALAPAGLGNSAKIHDAGKNATSSTTNTNETKSTFGTVLKKIGGAFTIGAGVVLAPIVGIIGGPIVALAPSKKSSDTQQKKEDFIAKLKSETEFASKSKIELAFRLGCKLAGLLPAVGKQMLTETSVKTTISSQIPSEQNQQYALNMQKEINQTLGSPSLPRFLDPLHKAFNVTTTSEITKRIENTLNNLKGDQINKFKENLETLIKEMFLDENEDAINEASSALQTILKETTPEPAQTSVHQERTPSTQVQERIVAQTSIKSERASKEEFQELLNSIDSKLDAIDTSSLQPLCDAFNINNYQISKRDLANEIKTILKDLSPDQKDEITGHLKTLLQEMIQPSDTQAGPAARNAIISTLGGTPIQDPEQVEIKTELKSAGDSIFKTFDQLRTLTRGNNKKMNAFYKAFDIKVDRNTTDEDIHNQINKSIEHFANKPANIKDRLFGLTYVTARIYDQTSIDISSSIMNKTVESIQNLLKEG